MPSQSPLPETGETYFPLPIDREPTNAELAKHTVSLARGGYNPQYPERMRLYERLLHTWFVELRKYLQTGNCKKLYLELAKDTEAYYALFVCLNAGVETGQDLIPVSFEYNSLYLVGIDLLEIVSRVRQREGSSVFLLNSEV